MQTGIFARSTCVATRRTNEIYALLLYFYIENVIIIVMHFYVLLKYFQINEMKQFSANTQISDVCKLLPLTFLFPIQSDK